MFQKISKTLFYMKIMVCKIPPGGSETLSGHWPTMFSHSPGVWSFSNHQ